MVSIDGGALSTGRPPRRGCLADREALFAESGFLLPLDPALLFLFLRDISPSPVGLGASQAYTRTVVPRSQMN
ncbi:MAG: hypothetical protein R3C05_13710 [Pirellulaceae bacterium]